MARTTARSRRRGGRASAVAPKRPQAAAASKSEPAPRREPDRSALVLGVLLALGLAALYVKTAPVDFVLGDTPEFMIVSAIRGVAHAPGYPLLSLLGVLVAPIPIGTLPFRLDVLAALCSVGAVLFVYLTALLLTRSAPASAAAAALLGVNVLFWRWANVLEAFPLNDLLAAAMLYFVVHWHERPDRSRYLIVGAFIGGLGMTDHQTIGLLVLAVLYVIWRRWRYLAAEPRLILACAAAFALGLLPYIYVPLAAARHPALNWQSVSSLSDLWALITRQSYGSTELIPLAQYRGGSGVTRVAALFNAFGPPGVLVAGGLIAAYRRAQWYAIATVLAFGVAGVFFAVYSNVNLALPFTLAILERFFLLPLVVAAPLAAFAIVEVGERIRSVLPKGRSLATAAVSAAALALVLAVAATGFGTADRAGYHAGRTFAEDILSSLEPNTLLFAGGDEVVLPLAYMQLVEQRRPDVRMLMLGMLNADWYVKQVRERYPDIVVPFARYVGQRDAMLAFAEANPGRPIALMGIAPDDSIKDRYWWLSRGLVLKLLPLSVDVTLDDLESDNERLFSSYRPPAMSDLRDGSLDRAISINYAMAAFRVGLEHENVQVYDGAKKWYALALKLDPDYALARDGLARLSK